MAKGIVRVSNVTVIRDIVAKATAFSTLMHTPPNRLPISKLTTKEKKSQSWMDPKKASAVIGDPDMYMCKMENKWR